MCTNGTADTLLVGTSAGSIQLFDLKSLQNTNNMNANMDYEALLKSEVKEWDTFDDHTKELWVNNCINKYAVLSQSYICDCLENYPHYAAIKKLVFIQRQASGIS